MRIGIDVDDTLVNLMEPLLYEVNRRYNKDIKMEQVTSRGELLRLSGATREEIGAMMDMLWQGPWYLDLIDSAIPAAIRALRNGGHDVYIVTYRFRENHRHVANWLYNSDIYYDGLMFIDNHKMTKASLPIDVFVDDIPDSYVMWQPKAAAIRPLYVPERPWNQEWAEGESKHTARIERVSGTVEALGRLGLERKPV